MPSSSGAGESDQQREAEGYNYSIYMMIAAPYLSFAIVAFLVYRGLRRKVLAEQTVSRAPAVQGPAPTGLRPATDTGGS